MKIAQILPLLLSASALLAAPARADLIYEEVKYTHDGAELEGYLVYEDHLEGKLPGVVVVHEWWGLNEYAKQRAEMLAGLGYVAFAVDMYGDDRVTEHGEQAGEWMRQITANVDRWQARAMAGLEVLRRQEKVDTDRLAAIGYCFGGATVMQMAYAGADLDGVVSFHGSLPLPPEDEQLSPGAIEAKVMVAHGNADTFVPRERVAAFKDAMEGLDVDLRFHGYDGARHGFTNPDAGKYGIENVQYDAAADKASWEAMKAFLAEVFAEG
jgi:dienelactone hydrolase